MKRIGLALLMMLFAFGCGQQDPKRSFERFASKYLTELQKVFNEEASTIAGERNETQPNTFLPGETHYDVRKTDSLYHPYEGSLTFSYLIKGRLSSKQTLGLRLSYEQGKWVPTTYFDPKDGASSEIGPVEHCKTLWDAYQRVKQ